MIRKALVGMAAIALVVSVTASGARADTESRDLFWANSAISGSGTQPLDCSANSCANPAPYVKLTIDRTDSTHATVTFDAYDGYTMGGSQAADLDVNASSFSISGLGGTARTGGSGVNLSTGSGNVSVFGSFTETTTEFDGWQWSLDKVTFTLTNLSGTWATAHDVTDNSAGNFWAAAHIFVCSDATCTAQKLNTDGTGLTGFVGGAATTGVPEPATIALLGLGLLSTGGIARRFKK